VTLRLRLTIILISVLATSTSAFAWLLVRATNTSLTKQMGDQLIAVASHDVLNAPPLSIRTPPSVDKSKPESLSKQSVDGDVRRFARFLFRADGKLLDAQQSGTQNNTDPAVDLPEIGSVTQRAMTDRITVRQSKDRSIRYLVLTSRVKNGIRFDAASLADVDQHVRRLTLIGVIGGASVTLLASLLSALLINRVLRPVDRMVATSEKIASGDLSARIPAGNSKTELGRLGASLNRVLNTIEGANKGRDAKESELRRFLADASHELRTPITVVQGYTDLYADGALADRHDLDLAMDRIDKQASRMSRLVQDLLLLANLEQSDFIHPTAINITELACESAREFLMTSPDHPVQVVARSDIFAVVDAHRMRQVIDNLLNNVRCHTPTGTKTTISVKQGSQRVSILVQDSGPGIPFAQHGHLFERFWQGPAIDARPAGSSGLGLAIVESIVEAHGGTITVASNPQDGTTFTVDIPTNHRVPVEPMSASTRVATDSDLIVN
jgi:two-component system, OmpR family, sensor kinase